MTCPKCGAEMEYEKGDPGEPPTMAEPMGGCPPTAPSWACDCGHYEIAEPESDDD